MTADVSSSRRECRQRQIATARRQRAHSIRRHLLAGAVIVCVLAGGVGGWAATTTVVRRADRAGLDRRRFQRQEGAAPDRRHRRRARVRDGDRVKAGDILVRLDDTVTRANLAIVTKGLDELDARKARLEAERDGAETIDVSGRAAGARRAIPTVAAIVDGERKLFELRRTARTGQKAQLQQRIEQLNEEIRGLTRSRMPRTRRSS